jgi:hypothetical protein
VATHRILVGIRCRVSQFKHPPHTSAAGCISGRVASKLSTMIVLSMSIWANTDELSNGPRRSRFWLNALVVVVGLLLHALAESTAAAAPPITQGDERIPTTTYLHVASLIRLQGLLSSSGGNRSSAVCPLEVSG